MSEPSISRADSKVSTFPPILVLSVAEAAGLSDLEAGSGERHSKSLGCASLSAEWPRRMAAVQCVLRAPTETAFHAAARTLDAQLLADAAACPAWAGPLAVQRMLVREHHGLYAPTHAADVATQAPLPACVGVTLEALRTRYETINDAAWTAASLQVGRSWAAWRAQAALDDVPARKQRYVINLATDASLLPGPTDREGAHYAALARVAPLRALQRQLATLQGQGPASAADVADYIAVSAAEAQAQGAARVLFVNVAAPQVPSFAEAVAQEAGASPVGLDYRDLADWQDGSVVTPEGAAGFALELVNLLAETPGKTLLVVNCNAGLDRSGTINALVQLLLEARAQKRAGAQRDQIVADAVAHVPDVVAALKCARPSSISSFGRYVFVYRALAAALRAEGLV